MVKSGTSEESALNEEQTQQLWGVCKEIADKVLIGLLAFCGLRVSEACHVRRTWIKEDQIHIPPKQECHCFECRKRGYWQPKTKAGSRIIPIPAFLRRYIYEFYQQEPEGLEITRQSAWYKVRALTKRAKLPVVFPHALRASAATLFAAKGLTGTELCYVMGWSRLEVGESYVRISQARQGIAAKFKQIWG